jgi:hypothetical protein
VFTACVVAALAGAALLVPSLALLYRLFAAAASAQQDRRRK